jgi:hypothetical protein
MHRTHWPASTPRTRLHPLHLALRRACRGDDGDGMVALLPDPQQAPTEPPLLVRTNLPGILLVHLRAAGLRVAIHGRAAEGCLRVYGAEPDQVRTIASDAHADVLQVLPLPTVPGQATPPRSRHHD